MTRTKVTSIATAAPSHVLTQNQAAELACELGDVDQRKERTVNVLYRRTGVQNRYTCVPYEIAREWYRNSIIQSDSGKPAADSAGPSTAQRMQWYAEFAPAIATESACKAIAASDFSAADVTHLVTVSCTGFFAPGLDIELIQRLGLPSTTQRLQVGFMGCHGAINGLRAAKAICDADPTAVVLLNATELCSIHYHFAWGSERLVGNSLFGDGSGSVVLACSEKETDWKLIDTGSCLIPDSKQAMSWDIGDLGFEMMLSAKIPDLIRSSLRPWLADWLAQRGETIESIQHWAVHPGGPRVLDAVEECLELPENATELSREVLRDYGNMSSPTVLFILERLRETLAGPCVVLGFGPGLMAEIALISNC